MKRVSKSKTRERKARRTRNSNNGKRKKKEKRGRSCRGENLEERLVRLLLAAEAHEHRGQVVDGVGGERRVLRATITVE